MHRRPAGDAFSFDSRLKVGAPFAQLLDSAAVDGVFHALVKRFADSPPTSEDLMPNHSGNSIGKAFPADFGFIVLMAWPSALQCIASAAL